MKRVSTFILCVAAIATLNAKPAFRGPIEKTQPDGTTITVYQHGDEHFHWTTDARGNWLAPDIKGQYVQVPALSEEQIANRRKASRLNAPQAAQQATPINLAPRGLIILVNFKDLSFKDENTQEVMRAMHNDDDYTYSYSFSYYGSKMNITAKGSAHTYFKDQSKGLYQPQFDVIGPVTVSNDMAYYGGNDSQGNDKNPEMMVKEACELADELGVDFSIYDNNNDGKVDFVYVIYAGYGEADGGAANTVWPHSYHLSYAYINLRLDGKQVDLYACGSELNFVSKKRAGISTFCHEFSHVLGLPDLYATNNSTHKTSGEWDIMDYGTYNNDGNTPPAYSAYERLFFGWAEPRVLNTYGEYAIKELQEFNDVCVITESGEFNGSGNDPQPTTFYTLENRQKKDWDRFLSGHGLMITKITYSYNKWAQNTVNNTKSAMGIDIIEADGNTPTYSQYDPDNGYFGKPGDLFPVGASEYWDIPNYGLAWITDANEVISFTLTDAQGIDDIIVSPDRTRKVFENGQVYIVRDGQKFTLLGERIE